MKRARRAHEKDVSDRSDRATADQIIEMESEGQAMKPGQAPPAVRPSREAERDSHRTKHDPR